MTEESRRRGLLYQELARRAHEADMAGDTLEDVALIIGYEIGEVLKCVLYAKARKDPMYVEGLMDAAIADALMQIARLATKAGRIPLGNLDSLIDMGFERWEERIVDFEERRVH